MIVSPAPPPSASNDQLNDRSAQTSTGADPTQSAGDTSSRLKIWSPVAVATTTPKSSFRICDILSPKDVATVIHSPNGAELNGFEPDDQHPGTPDSSDLESENLKFGSESGESVVERWCGLTNQRCSSSFQTTQTTQTTLSLAVDVTHPTVSNQKSRGKRERLLLTFSYRR